MNGIVRVESITKIYSLGDVKVEALRKVSFSVEAGEFLSIMELQVQESRQ